MPTDGIVTILVMSQSKSCYILAPNYVLAQLELRLKLQKRMPCDSLPLKTKVKSLPRHGPWRQG